MITWSLAILILAAVVAIVGILFVKDKSARKTMGWIGAIVFVLAVMPVAGVTDFGIAGVNKPVHFGTLSVNNPTGCTIDSDCGTGFECNSEGACVEKAKDADVTGCDLSATITYTLTAIDNYNGTATGGTNRYRLDDGAWTTVSNAGTISASPYSKLDVLWMNGAVTGYFSDFETYELPCHVTTISPKLYNNGTITSTVKDDAGTLVALATNNQTLAAGDVVDASVTLKGTFQRAFPYGFDAVVSWNNTEIDDVKLMAGGVEYSLGTKPQSDVAVYQSSQSQKTYSLPALMSNVNLVYDVHIDADNTVNPSAHDSYGAANVTITYYPKNMFVNDDKSGAADGPASQDESQTLTRAIGAGVSTIFYQ